MDGHEKIHEIYSAMRSSLLARRDPGLVARACAGEDVSGVLAERYPDDPLVVYTFTGRRTVARPVCTLLDVIAGHASLDTLLLRHERTRSLTRLVSLASRRLAAGDAQGAAQALMDILYPGGFREPPGWLIRLLDAYRRVRGAPRPRPRRGQGGRRGKPPVKTEALRYVIESGYSHAYAALLIYGGLDERVAARLRNIAYLAGLKLPSTPLTAFPSARGAVLRAARLGLTPREIAARLGMRSDKVRGIILGSLDGDPSLLASLRREGEWGKRAMILRYVAESGRHPAYAYLYAAKTAGITRRLIDEVTRAQARQGAVAMRGYRRGALFPIATHLLCRLLETGRTLREAVAALGLHRQYLRIRLPCTRAPQGKRGENQGKRPSGPVRGRASRAPGDGEDNDEAITGSGSPGTRTPPYIPVARRAGTRWPRWPVDAAYA